ncbi:MAG: hypothetical protein NTU57_00240 [Candidatus Aenigmarchaeota archaeon]|nr:hypothetical protein [Candidatus Aenigmarchaeota archaeon]
MAGKASLGRMTNGLYPDEAALAQVLKSAAHGNGGNNAATEPPKDSFDAIDERFGAMFWELPKAAIIEKIFGQLPIPKSEGLLATFYTNIVNGIKNRYNTQKHIKGQIAFENPFKIPFLRQFPFQNGWSAYKFSQGCTTINEIYTVVDSQGAETIFYIGLKGGKTPGNAEIENAARDLMAKDTKEIAMLSQNMLQTVLQRAENGEFTYGGCYDELTDRELGVLKGKYADPSRIKPIFMQNEISLYMSGPKQVVSNKQGVKIIKYSDPGSIKKLAYYTLASNIFTLMDIVYEPAEKMLSGSGFELQRMRAYDKEIKGTFNVANSAFNVQNRFGYVNNNNGQGGSHGGH